jgi:hypothetical protein
MNFISIKKLRDKNHMESGEVGVIPDSSTVFSKGVNLFLWTASEFATLQKNAVLTLYHLYLLTVEKDSLSANKWDEINGRKTDVKNTKPKKLSYAEIAKKRKLSWKRDESSKNTPQSE